MQNKAPLNEESETKRYSNSYAKRGLALIRDMLDLGQDDSLLSKGNQLFKEAKYEEALRYYEQAIRINENSVTTWHNRGSTLRKLKRYEEALSSYDKALDLNPNFIFAWRKKAEILASDLNCSEQSIYCYEQIISIDCNDHRAWIERGLQLFRLGKFQEALDSLKNIQGRINDPFLKIKIAEAYQEMKKLLMEMQKLEQEIE
jgi:tetratricopeptide (TPR) repeat protein